MEKNVVKAGASLLFGVLLAIFTWLIPPTVICTIVKIPWRCSDEIKFELKQTLDGHKSSVNSIVFSPDSTILASGSNDGKILLWDVITWKRRSSLPKVGEGIGKVNSLSFSHDGKLLAAGYNDGTIIIWDVNKRDASRELRRNGRAIQSVSISPDDKFLAAGSLDGITIWDMETGKEFVLLPSLGSAVSSLIFSRSVNSDSTSTLVASSRAGTIGVWRKMGNDTFSEVKNASQKFGLARSLAIDPTGTKLATGTEDGVISLWEFPSAEKLWSVKVHKNAVLALAFDPDGLSLVSGASDKTIKVLSLNNGKEKNTIGDDWALTLAFSPNGLYVAAGLFTNTINVWTRIFHNSS